ncbi:MAG: hypothetical protein QY321_03140 [Patescibacteria group bacterium]|nr:MAG: hypothetical protein QY321_03140 [Patescibacteria group bacterium]
MDLKKDKIIIKLNLRRCRELYDTGVLFDGGNNPFIQSVFIELMIRLRHLDHVLNSQSIDDSVIKKLRDAGAHPYLNREIDNGNIIIDFGRNFQGNWKYEDNILKKQDDKCDVSFQYGDSAISANEILKLIKIFEDQIINYES